MNIYYDPQDFLLTPIGEIEWSSGSYEFDLTVVWKREDGRFVYAEDSGCSCPSPFEDTSPSDLIVLPKSGALNALKEHCESRNADTWDGDRSAEIVALIEKMHAAGAR